MKKTILAIAILLGYTFGSFAQSNSQILFNADGDDKGSFVYWVGEFDASVANPDTNSVNNSPNVVMYERSGSDPLAVVTFYTQEMMRAGQYATLNPAAPKFKMMVYTDAPSSKKIQILVGNKDVHDYPAGFHSVYETTVSKQFEWQELTFNFLFMVQDGLTDTTLLNKLVFMFAPGTSDSSTYYFDNIMGPEFSDFSDISVEKKQARQIAGLRQNFPNPVYGNTNISYSIVEPGIVNLKLYNVVGQEVRTLASGYHAAGDYNVFVDTEGFTDGIYFYTLCLGEFRQTKKLTLAKGF